MISSWYLFPKTRLWRSSKSRSLAVNEKMTTMEKSRTIDGFMKKLTESMLAHDLDHFVDDMIDTLDSGEEWKAKWKDKWKRLLMKGR